MWLLSCVSSHVNHQHVLGFERSLLSRALLPVTHKLLFLSVDVLVVDVLNKRINKSSILVKVRLMIRVPHILIQSFFLTLVSVLYIILPDAQLAIAYMVVSLSGMNKKKDFVV